ncbi:MAG TPA: putative toxin-antitoxin system toxin component, PIN family [Chloroflexota bacterium]|nr:putative toxin-antitoxin system toxin component, PIN family [Chloroflexota bacterium]
MTVTLDVNVLVSGLIGSLGFSRRVIQAWQEGKVTIVTSDGILKEFDDKLRLPRIRKRLPNPDENRLWIMQLLQTQAQFVLVPPTECLPVTGDPEDDYVLATARLGQAEYIVTGDQGRLRLAESAGARIVSPKDFVELLTSMP